MEHIVVGLNHKTAPVSLREKLAVDPAKLDQTLKALVNLDCVDEGLIVSTCNRMEVYAVARNGYHCVQGIENFVADLNHLGLDALKPHLYEYRELDAIRHVFRVASSLDSLVVGEAQISGQVKEAYRKALEARTTGLFLNRWMHRAFFVAKKIRTDTKVSQKKVSVGSAAVELAKKIFGDLSSKKVALIGAGEVAELVLGYLESEGVYDVSILNRNIEKARGLADLGLGEAYSLDSLEEVLHSADVVIASVSTAQPILGREKTAGLMAVRKHRPIFFIDLGVPRNLDSAIQTLSNVYLYNIDDLQEVVDSNMTERLSEAGKAEILVEKEASQFYESVVRQVPTIAALGKKFDTIRRRELERTLGKLSHLGEDEKKAVERCTEAIVDKILHDPVLILKSEGPLRHDSGVHELLKKLFRLDDE
ncbi:MAG: glutamyl-tRNA reductase [Deltaproteobacteria bacterium]|nr:glutamyl-tRNA reductase [Deltaproteobacteria bacterium]